MRKEFCYIETRKVSEKKEDFVLKGLLRWIIIIAPIAYGGLIWYLSGRPSDAVIRFRFADAFIKESLHLIEFAILYVLIVLSLLANGHLTRKTNVFAALISILYGLIDEIHQSFVPFRSATVIDFVKDTLGVMIAYMLIDRGYFLKKNLIGKGLDRFQRLFY
ncbi:VanZ family protein [Fervidibacillus halotolerans]|uniref:VanZ family protein n=1 Tax=Fervidibacillus halotolerans TaxID=2980027 RepID=A0A9E8RYM1_9BACI|nr:VanZ family protein [Fervidibacillus halotolerans]WAA13980.1 VanZ family protein [Fervidibacillus halotolerans]